MDDVCKRCGDTRPGTTACSRCGGHGLILGAYGDPTDCPDCGCGGVQWPPRCLGCGGFRKQNIATFDPKLAELVR